MILDAIILLIVLVPIVLVVVLRRRKDLRTSALQVSCEILGVFLLVLGCFLLFGAFYPLFHEQVTGPRVALLGVSLSLVFGGYALVKWADKKPRPG
jgi:cytochrome c biogenesis factor